MGRVLFLSAVAYLAFRYIKRSNHKALEMGKQGSVEILPPQSSSAPVTRGAATEELPAGKSVRRLSGAVEDNPY